MSCVVRKNSELFLIAIFSVCLSVIPQKVFAKDIYVNFLAVNGTEVEKEKEIKEYLPKELSIDDIVDTGGLNLNYDVSAEAYYVESKVNLGPKESKTFKVRVRDVWQVDNEEIKEIKGQIDASYERMKGTEFESNADAKRKELLRKLDSILQQQAALVDDIERRIDYYRAYAGDIEKIRTNSLSVKYWRTKLPEVDTSKTITQIIETANTSKEKEKDVEAIQYLPSEVKPEHIVDFKDFNFRFDAQKDQPYLTKQEKLNPGESKRYEIEIVDIWHIPQEEIDGLKDRTRKAYSFLEDSEYAQSAGYLVASIKEQLEAVEESQKIEREITEHISAYRANEKRYKKAETDVKALEELLEAVRENLERSKVKNVLQKIRSLKSIADIAQSIFKRPDVNTAWKIIMGIVIFVGMLTGLHFLLWNKKSKVSKDKKKE